MNDNQTRIIIILGSALAVLLIVLIFVLISGDGGDTDAADTSTTEATTTTVADDTSTSEATTTSAAATSSTTSSSTTTSSTTTSSTTTTTTMPAPPNFALSFDGLDDYASIFNLSGDFDFGDGMLVEAWVKPASLETTGDFAGIVRGAFQEPPGGGGKWVFFLHDDDHTDWGYSGCTPGCSSATSGPGGLVVGEWQHIAAQYDGVTIQIYRNGQFVDSSPLSGDLGEIDFVLLGIWTDSFHGVMDEVRIWNTPRGPAAIGADWNRVLDGDEVGLVGYYRFDEGSGQLFSDSSTRGNDGKLGNNIVQDVQDPLWVPSDIPIP